MIIAEINTCDYGSTGRIMLHVAEMARKCDHDVKTYSRRWFNQHDNKNDHCYFGFVFENVVHHVLAPLTGYAECFSVFGTKDLIKQLDDSKVDVIHLHNLHGWYINLPLLFDYIKKNNIRVIWTLHDCWAFTGQCPYFTMVECDKWKSGCYNCHQHREYPGSYIDRTKTMWRLKKKWFTGVKNLTIITPSHWLADLVKQSFLKEYPVQVIHNGIDLDVFKPTDSDFRSRYNCGGKIILLGVAFGWGVRKGLDVFIELARRLDDRYQIVLVGTDDKTDKQLPGNIISIHRTQNQRELAEIYTAADLFVNPTREEVLGMVNIEALACGTPVVTYNTGGCPEIIDETCGSVVDCGDVEGLISEIIRITQEQPYMEISCLERAKYFEKTLKFQEYVELYIKDLSMLGES